MGEPLAKWALACLLGLALTMSARRVHADMDQDVRRIARAWDRAGARVERRASHFVFERDHFALDIGLDSARPCASVIVVGPPGAAFRVTSDVLPRAFGLSVRDEGVPLGGWSSAGGMLELHRCGGPIGGVRVSSAGGRGALTVLVGRSTHRIPAARDVLVERAVSHDDVAIEVKSNPLDPRERVRRYLRQAADRGAKTRVERMRADDAGELRVPVGLDAGCTRVDIVSSRDPSERKDVDAELWGADGEPIAVDRSPDRDARVAGCASEPSRANLRVSGAAQNDDLGLVVSEWSMPSSWGRVGRRDAVRTILGALYTQGAPIAGELVQIWDGVSGATTISRGVLPDGCYVAVGAVAAGRVMAFQLTAEVDGETRQSARDPDGAVVAFCRPRDPEVRFRLVARGLGVRWTLGLIRVDSPGEVERGGSTP